MKSSLKGKGASSSLAGLGKKDKAQDRDHKARITTVHERVDTTYKVSPLTMRLSLSDKKAVNDWVDELQEDTKRKVSPAKLMRALTAMKDEIDQDKLLALINDM
ncbi:hypothetical protein CTH30272_03067 [Allocatenococcus thiocycli]|nr:hypothetical protein CTH30272_03067 [Catenococcus thiocycli]